MQDGINQNSDAYISSLIAAERKQLNSLVYNLMIMLKKYIKYIESTKLFVGLSRYEFQPNATDYHLLLRVGQKAFMRDFIEEIFRSCSPSIKQSCHSYDNDNWYLLEVKFRCYNKYDTYLRVENTLSPLKFIFKKLIKFLAIAEVTEVDVYLPYKYHELLKAPPNASADNYQFNFDWIDFFVEYEDQCYTLKSCREANRILEIYIGCLDKYLKILYPTSEYPLIYETT